jgi:Putative transposase
MTIGLTLLALVAEGVLQYLSRYTHRVAISTHRILTLEDGNVSFLWRDNSDGNRNKIMTLDANDFIRRFLLHVLPARFVKIRYNGLLGSRNRKATLIKCHELLGLWSEPITETSFPESEGQGIPSWQEMLFRVSGIDLSKCPSCREGRMRPKEILWPIRCARAQ